VAIGESWDENYGAGGVQNGPNIPFTVPAPAPRSSSPTTRGPTCSPSGRPARRGATSRGPAPTGSGRTSSPGGPPTRPPWTRLVLRPPLRPGRRAVALEPAAGERRRRGGDPARHDPAGLPAEVRRSSRTWRPPAFRLPASRLAEVPEALRSQLAVSALAGSELMDATSLQIPGVLDDLYTYGGPLGVVRRRRADSRPLGADGALRALHLFADSDPRTPGARAAHVLRPGHRRLERREASWSVSTTFTRWRSGSARPGRWSTTWSPTPTRCRCHQQRRSQIVDLDDPALEPPAGTCSPSRRFRPPRTSSSTSSTCATSAPATPRCPRRSREPSRPSRPAPTACATWPRWPRRASPTSTCCRPSTSPRRRGPLDLAVEPAGDLGSYPPDSDQQQAAVAAVADQDGFNWGYDPWHYTVPEGSYATDPTARRASASSGRWWQALSRRPAGGDGRGLQPHQRLGPERQVGARPGRPRLLPPAQRRRRRSRPAPPAARTPPASTP
jgi:pullulanase